MKKITLIISLLLLFCTVTFAQPAPPTGYPMPNFPTGGSIGLPTNTIDKYATINISQSTTGQELILPIPTYTSRAMTVKIRNVGTAMFYLQGYGPLYPASYAQADWTGEAWSFLGSMPVIIDVKRVDFGEDYNTGAGAVFVAENDGSTLTIGDISAGSGSIIFNPTEQITTVTTELRATSFRLSGLGIAPINSSYTGTIGEIRVTDSYVFICVATNSWKRIPLTSFP